MSENYTPVTLIRKDSEGISQTQIVDGQILFDTEEHKLYMDNGNSRDSYGGGSDEAQVISYTDFMNLTPAQRESGKYLVTGMTPMTNAYNLDYKDGKTVGQELDTVNQHLTDNDKEFKFGYQNGEYGYYKQEGGADTFAPFNKIKALVSSSNFQTSYGYGSSFAISYDSTLIDSVAQQITSSITIVIKKNCKLRINAYAYGRDSGNRAWLSHNSTLLINGTAIGGTFDINASANDTISLATSIRANNDYALVSEILIIEQI